MTRRRRRSAFIADIQEKETIMSKKTHVIHFISNTHWDREWLMNFQETRLMLVEVLDRMLDIFDKYPDYNSFVLDAQTVPVEDYLEVRPENRERLEKHVRDGRLLIGPWYTDPEGFSVGGESMVRNLLYGHRVAEGYGGVMKVGHTPFGYGQNSQMPQLYQGFDIDTILFYHGVSHEEVENEFIYEGADGTRILASQMSSYARYNAYHNVYRPALYGDQIDDRGYDWKRGGLPFRLCRDEPAMRHHLRLDVEKGWNTELLRAGLTQLRDDEIKVATTRHLTFMMGHDSSIPDERELDIIAEAQKLFPEDEVKHGNYVEMMDAIKAEVDWETLTVLKGERRTPKPMPVSMHLYSDVLSSRSRMKALNTKAEYLLQRRAEPFALVASQLGAAYPAAMLDLAWKSLLRCHAHDSIAGSGVDDIEEDMMYRLRQVVNLSDGLLRNALGAIQCRIDNSNGGPEDVFLTVFNPSAQSRTEVVTAQVDLPASAPCRYFRLIDEGTGKPVDVQVSTRKPHTAIANHLDDAPANLKTEQFVIHFKADNVPGMGYRGYRVEREHPWAQGNLITADRVMENEYLLVILDADGTFSVLHKETDTFYEDLNYFQDNGEAGHAWMHHDPARDQVIDSRGFPVRISLEEDGPLQTAYRVDCMMQVPARLEENHGDPWQRLDGVGNAASRSKDTVPMTVTSRVVLRAGARHVEVNVSFDNQAKNHRLRVLFPTSRAGTTAHAESAFDVVERDTVFDENSPWHGTKHVTFPQQRFVDVSDGEDGLAILNSGQREYEITQDADRAIALTLMRAYEVSLATVSKCWEQLPDMIRAQSPGAHEFSYRIFPHAGDYAYGGVLPEADIFCAPMEVAQAGSHGGDLPKAQGFLDVQPAGLALSACKRAEDGSGWVLRLHNPTDNDMEGAITLGMPLKSAALLRLDETLVEELAVDGNAVKLTVEAKKIVTLKLEC
jgi:mannosylglycerate hydrolase